MSRRFAVIISIVTVISASPIVAAGPDATNPSPAGGSESAEEQELLKMLAEQTDIATKTRMNSDFVPGLVTVLHGEELEALGVHTAWEALQLVPGIQTVRDPHASPSMTVRAIDFVFNTGNVKVLVNGVSLSRESAGIDNSVLFLPVEQIDRIEMIRGPGSAVHGDFAFQGLVNIVTRTDRDRFLVWGQSPQSFTGVVESHWASKDEATRVSVSFSGLWADDADVQNPLEASEDRRAGIIDAEGKFGWLRAQAITRTFDVDQPPGPGPTLDLDESNWALGWGGRFSLGGKWSIDPHVVRSNTKQDTYPPLLFEGSVTDVGSDFIREGEKHDTLIGLGWWEGLTDHARFQPPPIGGGPPPPANDYRGLSRTVKSLTFQEVFRPIEKLSFTIGARWDGFDDDQGHIDDEVSPRVAIVWRASDKNVIKVQHARAFRAPTFFEMATPVDPDSENMATSELAWIHRRTNAVVRVSAFRSEFTDGIGPTAAGPANVREATVNGLEAEWSQTFAEKVKIFANVSYADPNDGADVFGWSHWLANFGIIANPRQRFTAAMRWYHVGTRFGGGDDFDGYEIVDATFGFKDAGAKGLCFRFGVKNVLDDDVVHPLPTPTGAVDTPTYDGRTCWASIAWEW